jgi:hypothetical protein
MKVTRQKKYALQLPAQGKISSLIDHFDDVEF